jgi:hypothetical protein
MGCGDTDLMRSGVERSSGKKQTGRAGALSVEQTVMSVYDPVARLSLHGSLQATLKLYDFRRAH